MAELQRIPTWSELPDRDAIYKEFRFDDFKHCFAFMIKVAERAEASDHHPGWPTALRKLWALS